ncbi:hypothetical protein AKJ09_04631 [Labilithrix luteola]|uniref:Uncharacterized protein n=1 Tax=Labilithrix luteola TaxID=1391654 RepID=A0A0K1PWS5_9BACT|nr:hypothetical protein AKJ09_04631 [Labilithrix luteola]
MAASAPSIIGAKACRARAGAKEERSFMIVSEKEETRSNCQAKKR